MTVPHDTLPSELADLREYCLRLLTELNDKNQHIEKLLHELELFKRMLYGRRSEKLDPGQLMLEFAEWLKTRNETTPTSAEATPGEEAKETGGQETSPQSSTTTANPPKRKGHGRRPLSGLLRREQVIHDATPEECQCPECGGQKEKIGQETSAHLNYRPASIFVVEHVRLKYACLPCEGHVVTAAKPPQPIEKGLPGAGLLAQVVTAKFDEHCPLERQVQIYARQGADLAPQTLGDWVEATADIMKPVYDDLKASVLASSVMATDDTPVRVLDRSRTKTREGRLWVYVGDATPDSSASDIVYDYTANHSQEGPLSFMQGFRGYLQADAYTGYDALYAKGHVVEVGCMAHARRYFWEARSSAAPRALLALSYIQQLYKVEAEAKAKNLDAEGRRQLRQKEAQPVLDRFKTWLDEQADQVLPKSPLGQAIGYARGQWEALCRYAQNGHLGIDNNISERALRRIAVGRNNWLFCGSDAGGKRAAILYSIVATCKEHGVDVWAYLNDVLERIPTHPASRRAELLPRNWKVLHPSPRD